MELSKNQLKRYRQLQQKKYREKENLFIIEGKKMVFEAIQNYADIISEVICTETMLIDLPLKWKSIAITTSYDSISKISALKNPQEIIAILNKPQYNERAIDKNKKLELALDNITDPGNMGTIIRMADWFGIENIFCSLNCVDCYNPKVVQATMGGILRVKVEYVDLTLFLKNAITEKKSVYGTALDGKNIYTESINFPAIIVMGNESTGLSGSIKSIVNKSLFIPNFSENVNTSESLNVSTATAIALSEFKRQQFYSK